MLTSDIQRPQLDLEFIRSCFPAFQEPVGAKTAFLENASGSYMVRHVIDRLMHYSVVRVQPYGYSEILHGERKVPGLLKKQRKVPGLFSWPPSRNK